MTEEKKLEYLKYIEEHNPNMNMFQEKFNFPNRYRREKTLKDLGVKLRPYTKEEQAERVRIGFQKKYGVDNISQLDSNKKKVSEIYHAKSDEEKQAIRDKMAETSLERYGSEHYVQTDEYVERVKATNMERYGVEWNIQSDEVQEKMKESMIEKYGIDNLFKDPELQKDFAKRRDEALIERYNTDNPVYIGKNPEYVKIIRDREALINRINNLREDGTKPDILELYNSFDQEFAIDTLYNNIRHYGITDLMEYNSKVSSYEDEIYEFLLELLPEEDIIRSSRPDWFKITDDSKWPSELDIFIPKYNLAIEFNGTYWHSYQNLVKVKSPRDSRNYHFDKKRTAEEEGINLIHIWQYLWDNPQHKERYKSIIRGELGMTPNKIYARKCFVRKATDSEYREFIEGTSLYGFRGALYKYALVEKDTDRIVMVMGISKKLEGGSKSNHENDYEVVRSATLNDTIVIGGSSKLFKHIMEDLKDLDINSMTYFVDYDCHLGNSLKHMDFEFQGYTGPTSRNYWPVYINEDGSENIHRRHVVLYREPHRHKEIINLSENGKVFFLYNSGTKKYVWNKRESDVLNN